MRKKLLYFFVFILISIQTTAQERSSILYGYVYDLQNSDPLEGVNVFISGTLIGTSTNEDGFFEIVNVPIGTHELIISMVGFVTETEVIKVDENGKFKLIYRLKTKSYELDSVTIVSQMPEGWLENLDIFKEKFLGDNDYSEDCIIENEIELDFFVDENNYLIATIDKPIVIINKALGYQLECELINFSYDKNIGEYNYLIQPLFTELHLSGDELEEAKENRLETYLGSLNHFVKCLIDDNWMKEGYEIKLFKDINSDFAARSIFYTEELFNLSTETGKYSFKFRDYLRVDYKYGNKSSVLELAEDEVWIDSWGYPVKPQAFILYGDWAKYGASKMLPRYVNFEEVKE